MGAIDQAVAARDAAAPADRLWTIGDLAREFGVTLRTLRFYEDKGMLSPLRQGATRLYRPEDKRRLQLILTGKKLGFTLVQIRQLLESGQTLEDPSTHQPAIERALTPAQLREQLERLERQRADLDSAISRLRRTHELLTDAA
ncbi:MAG: MerR family transcriptional regulator [Methylobacteriaceae bacterium]|nr:MerR family transcriptional regulator [Methylobacteriaceae bacterium]